MNQQLILFYLKRHAIGLVGLILAIAFVVSGFMMKGKAEEAASSAETSYTEVEGRRTTLESGLAMGGDSQIRVDDKNKKAAEQEVDVYNDFVEKAEKVFKTEVFDSAPVENHANFSRHLVEVIEELNQRAREANVGVITNRTNATVKNPYNFTFAYLRSSPQLSRDKLPTLQKQLKDVRTIAGVLFQSDIQSIESIKRTRVCNEDFAARAAPQYLDSRKVYTNDFTAGEVMLKLEVNPYQLRFKGLSGSIAKALNGFASETETFYVVRKMEVTQLGAKSGSSTGGGGFGEGGGGFGDGGGGFGDGGGGPGEGGSSSGFPGFGGAPPGGGSGFPGFGGAPPGGGSGFPGATGAAKPTTALDPAFVRALVSAGYGTPAATNVVSEAILEVEMDLDVIRKVPDPNATPEIPAAPAPQPQPGGQPDANQTPTPAPQQ